ncbi:MAG TPA: hypothetical protein VK438_02035 [Xanthobacteraceae bacterium]|nr:hypothetical protein [Xanthobacteraceae bacterium]
MKLKLPFRHPLYAAFQLVFALCMLAWGIAYGYAEYRWDDCSDNAKAQLAALQMRLDKVQAREDALKARAKPAQPQQRGN